MVEDGIAASLARPGGSITGLAGLPWSRSGPKMLQMFRQVVPSLRRVAELGWPVKFQPAASMDEATAALGLPELPRVVAHPTDPEISVARVVELRVDGMLVVPTSTNDGHRNQPGRLAYEARLPSIDTNADAVQGGALMSYAGVTDEVRRVAHYIDKIFKGAKAGELPMELPMRFDLVINSRRQRPSGSPFHSPPCCKQPG